MKYQRQYGSPPPHKNILRGALAVVCLTAAILIVYGIMDSGIGALGGILGDSSSAASGGVREQGLRAFSCQRAKRRKALFFPSASSTASSEPACYSTNRSVPRIPPPRRPQSPLPAGRTPSRACMWTSLNTRRMLKETRSLT
ncbi:MAG: hypothetical protein ACLSB9_06235 [Hydrogeniiclostridium mannosilyticum]